ncbi:hypothetical protein PVAND_005295 [Polypedilum vanderplanki]|uniref:TIL domain-containing protein n=1 Tax=Polypedilum vanderplanki TaxID=319348 RepID=A0A9J6C0P0_POLVA|nr:hypothetical protein PVAND_005295 [Polypedilum vanderplanki]
MKILFIFLVFSALLLGISAQCTKPNEVYTRCGTACPERCDFVPTLCTYQCVIGCSCKRGYVRDANNNCILREECP